MNVKGSKLIALASNKAIKKILQKKRHFALSKYCVHSLRSQALCLFSSFYWCGVGDLWHIKNVHKQIGAWQSRLVSTLYQFLKIHRKELEKNWEQDIYRFLWHAKWFNACFAWEKLVPNAIESRLNLKLFSIDWHFYCIRIVTNCLILQCLFIYTLTYSMQQFIVGHIHVDDLLINYNE